MPSLQHHSLRDLVDTYTNLSGLLSSLPADAIEPGLLGRLFRILRQCQPYRDLLQLRRAALMAQFGVTAAPDGRFVPPGDDEDGRKWTGFEAAWLAFLGHEEAVDIDAIPWAEAAAGIQGLSAGHLAALPCAFVLDDTG